jgi:hypothetical protein
MDVYQRFYPVMRKQVPLNPVQLVATNQKQFPLISNKKLMNIKIHLHMVQCLFGKYVKN